jgi:hypothetical protein
LKASNQGKIEEYEGHNATKSILKGKHASPKKGMLFYLPTKPK